MRKYNIREIDNSDKEYLQRSFPQHSIVGILKEDFNDGRSVEKVILKMKRGYKGWTPSGTVRDCGSHYIISRYSSYDSIYKKTFSVTHNVEDK